MRWQTAFGAPVEPVVNFQSAGSSFAVRAGSSVSGAAAAAAVEGRLTRPSLGSPTTRIDGARRKPAHGLAHVCERRPVHDRRPAPACS